MLQEINNFMNSLPAELKQAGLKPKEGLHVLLKIQEKEGTHFMDEQSVCRVCLTRKATEFDYPFLQHCAELAQVGWCVNTNSIYSPDHCCDSVSDCFYPVPGDPPFDFCRKFVCLVPFVFCFVIGFGNDFGQ